MVRGKVLLLRWRYDEAVGVTDRAEVLSLLCSSDGGSFSTEGGFFGGFGCGWLMGEEKTEGERVVDEREFGGMRRGRFFVVWSCCCSFFFALLR